MRRGSEGHLRILFMCHNPKGTGTYVRAYELARGLSLLGHDVTLMAVSVDWRFRTRVEKESTLKIILCPGVLHDGFFINRLTSCGGWGPLDILQRIKVGMSGDYDIIQMFDHFPNIAIPYRYLRARGNVRFVSDWCDIYHLPGGFADSSRYRLDWFYRKVNFLFKNSLRNIEVSLRKKADAVTVISHQMKRVAIDCGIDQGKISIIEGGVDTDKIKPLPQKDCRMKVGIPLDSKVIVFLGRSQFDLDILIRSFAQVRKHFANSYLMIIGTNSLRWPKELAADLGILDRYIEVGHCSEEMLPFHLCSGDIFALPMKKNLINETRWPNKIGEYMACGRPTVVSDVGEVAEVVEKHEIGLVAKTNVDSFSEKMQILLSDYKLAEDMGRKARELACKKYSWASMAARLEKVYFELLNSTKKRGTRVDEQHT